MTQTQRCRYCGDFYRIYDDQRAIETDDGWVIDICRQCHTEFNCEEETLEAAWHLYYQQLDADERGDEQQ